MNWQEERDGVEPSRCPYIITKRAGDESLDICGLDDRVCSLVGGYECEEWNKIQEEEK